MFNRIASDLRQNIDSLLISLLCCVPMMSFILDFNNVIPIILAILLSFTIIYKRFLINISILNDRILIAYIVIFSSFLLLNIVLHGLDSHSIKRISYFGVYGVLPISMLYILYQKKSEFNLFKIFQYINCLYAIMSVFVFGINFWQYSPQEKMSVSYYILPVFLSVFFEFLSDENKNIKYKLIKYFLYFIIFIPYLHFATNLMSRGAILSIAVCIYLTFLSLQSKKRKIRILLISFIAALILVCFGIYILEFISNLLSSLGVSFSFIDKNLRLLQENSIGNGRDVIYHNVISGISNHPVIGSGIGEFERVFATYPHNFVLQSWYEGGFVYMCILVIPNFYSIVRIIFNNNISNKKKYFFIFIFSLSIIRLLLSFEYWKDLFFWIYLFMSLLLIQEDLKHYIEKRGK